MFRTALSAVLLFSLAGAPAGLGPASGAAVWAAAAPHPSAAAATATAALPNGPSFHPLTGARLFDSRIGKRRLGAGATRTLQVVGRASVPASGVTAVVVNVTAIGPTLATSITAWPADAPRRTSSLSVAAGDVRSALVEVALGGGRLSLYNARGTVHLVVDVFGWVGPATAASSGGELRTLRAARLADTRYGVGVSQGAVAGGKSLTVKVLGRGGVPTAGVSAVLLNVTVLKPSRSTYVTAWPTGAARSAAWNLGVTAGRTVVNRVVVRVGSLGRISLYHGAGTVHFVVDVGGYFTAKAGTGVTGGTFRALTPTRFVDTRAGVGAVKRKLGAGGTLTVRVAGQHGVPGAESQQPPTSVVATLTATNVSAATSLTAWATGSTRPAASDVLVDRDRPTAELIVAQLGPDGTFRLRNQNGTVDVVIDVLGFNSGDVVLQSSAVVLNGPESAAVSSITASTVTFSSTPGAVGALKVGQVINSGPTTHARHGFLRRITAVHAAGSGVTVDTTPAALPDVLRQGWVDLSAPARGGTALTPHARPLAAVSPAISGSAGGVVSVPLDHTFVDTGGASVTTSGTFTASAGVDVAFDIGWTGLRSASLTAHAEDSFSAALDANYQGSWAADVPLGSVTFEPIVFDVGPVFVEVQPKVTATLRATGAVDGSVHAAASQSASLRQGVAYANGALQRVDVKSSVPPTLDDFTVNATVDARVGVEAKVDAAFYGGRANLAVGIEPYLRAHADRCYANLYAGLDGSVHADISVLGHSETYDGQVNLAELRLTSVDLQGPCWHGSITFTGQASQQFDDGSSAATAYTIIWTLVEPVENGDGSYVVDVDANGSWTTDSGVDANGCETTNTITLDVTERLSVLKVKYQGDGTWALSFDPFPTLPMNDHGVRTGPPICNPDVSDSTFWSYTYYIENTATSPDGLHTHGMVVTAPFDATALTGTEPMNTTGGMSASYDFTRPTGI